MSNKTTINIGHVENIPPNVKEVVKLYKLSCISASFYLRLAKNSMREMSDLLCQLYNEPNGYTVKISGNGIDIMHWSHTSPVEYDLLTPQEAIAKFEGKEEKQ